MWNRQQVLRVSLSLAALCLASGFPVLSMADSPQPVSGLNHQYQHFSFGGLAGLTSAYTHTNNGIFNATHTLAEPSPLLSNFLSQHTLDANAVRLYNNEPDTGNLGLHEHRGKLAQLASVCFITDAGNCSGAGTGSDLGGSSSSGPGPIEPDNDERCRLEGYTNQKCSTGQTPGSKCPYDGNWHSGCKCSSEYNKTCTGANEQGKGTACDGKYKECCNPCTGYDYTASNIPAGYVKNGSCNSCDGTKYKIKCDTNTSNTGTYVDCGTAGGTGGTCSDDTGTYYKECTCPNMYEWSASSKKCVCSTGYKYTCTGSNISGGEGAACDNKYQKCKCKTGFTWSASSGMCTCSGTDWCTLNQDCSSLGYKQQSCPERTIKCPFNTNYVYCISCPSNYKSCSGEGMVGSGATCGGKYTSCACTSGYEMKSDGLCWTTCNDNYKYTCDGENETGGVGNTCNRLYNACKCSSGYNWNAASGACIPDSPVCAVGTLYYSDNTCSSSKVSGKTLLGVVIYSNGASGGGWIMTIKPVKTGILWSTERVDIPGLTNITSESSLTDIQASCTNTDVITAYGSSSTYPAAWAAKNYKPTGTPSGKSWCLPSGGLLNNLNNYVNFDRVNVGITIAGGEKIENVERGAEYVWSSSEYSNRYVWYFCAHEVGASYICNGDKDYYVSYNSVRPVLAF